MIRNENLAFGSQAPQALQLVFSGASQLSASDNMAVRESFPMVDRHNGQVVGVWIHVGRQQLGFNPDMFSDYVPHRARGLGDPIVTSCDEGRYRFHLPVTNRRVYFSKQLLEDSLNIRMPPGVLDADHIDRNRCNNMLSNLRNLGSPEHQRHHAELRRRRRSRSERWCYLHGDILGSCGPRASGRQPRRNQEGSQEGTEHSSQEGFPLNLKLSFRMCVC